MRHSKGFTLIELMIVIVVIGVLAAMMMMSSTEAADIARANNIMSNLEIMRKAVLSYRADHYDDLYPFFGKDNAENAKMQEDVKKYIGDNKPDLKYYDVTIVHWDDYNLWFVRYRNNELAEKKGIRTRLEGQAKSRGLYCGNNALHSGTYCTAPKGDTIDNYAEKYTYTADNSYPALVLMRAF